jgi:hypothetical protein
MKKLMQHISKPIVTLALLLGSNGVNAQIYHSTTSAETTYPTAATYLNDEIDYLQCSSLPVGDEIYTVAAFSQDARKYSSYASRGGGVTFGYFDMIGNYNGVQTIDYPGVSSLCAVVMNNPSGTGNVIVAYANIGTSGGCGVIGEYYYDLYQWNPPAAPTFISTGNFSGSGGISMVGSFFDRISIAKNHNSTKAVIALTYNNSAIFTKAFDFSQPIPLQVGPTQVLHHEGNRPDVAFRYDPSTGEEHVHFAYFSYYSNGGGSGTFPNCFGFGTDVDWGLSYLLDRSFARPTYIHFKTDFSSLHAGTAMVDYNSMRFVDIIDTNVQDIMIDCPDISTDNMAYTLSWDTGGISYTSSGHTPSMVWPLGLNNIPINFGTIVTGSPNVSYHPTMTNRYFAAFSGGPAGYAALGRTDNVAATVFTATDFLEVPSTPVTGGTQPRIALCKNSAAHSLYTVFTAFDGVNTALVHKLHPWTLNTAWKQTQEEEEAAAPKALAYPNPFKEGFAFNDPMHRNWQLRLTDIQGRTILQCDGVPVKLNQQLNTIGNQLNSGIYLLHASASDGSTQQIKLNKL